MTEQPYTDNDLRAQAVLALAALADAPDFMGIGEGMEDSLVRSAGEGDDPKTWGELLPYNHDDGNAYNEAQRKIHRLVRGAADLSEWTVHLGADGLEPDEQRLNVGDARVRIHFAFASDMSEADRRDFVAMIAATVITGG